jgi:hypothetical protein
MSDVTAEGGGAGSGSNGVVLPGGVKLQLPTVKTLLANARRGDVALAVGVMTILMVLVVPLPAWLLDMALAISITLSVMILMTSLFIQSPLEFSSFPTVLLIATMLRLSLNMASTRLILSHRHHRLCDPADRQFHRYYKGFRPYCRSRGALHPRCHARQADGDRRRSLGRPHRREGRQATPQRA